MQQRRRTRDCRGLAFAFAPVDPVAERCGRAGDWLLVWLASGVRFGIRPGAGAFAGRAFVFVTDRSAHAQADLLFFHVDLNDLEIVLQSLLEGRLTVDGIAGL